MTGLLRPSCLWIAAAAALAAGCGSGSGGAADPAGETPGGAAMFLLPVTYVAAEPGVVEERVSLVGDVVSARQASLAFERAGRISEILADLGDEVAAGAVLARLDDAVLEAQLAGARADAAAAAVEAAFAEGELRRARDVGSALADSERDRWASEAGARRQRAEQKAAEVRRLEAVLAQGELRAPFPCAVTARQATLGSHVGAGDAVFEVVDLWNREVHLEIPAYVAAGLKSGAPVTLAADEISNLRLDASLDVLVPAADPSARTFRGVVRLGATKDPERRLLPGMFVRAQLLYRRAASEVVVPVDSLVEDERGVHVAVAGEEEPARARLVPVQVLARDDHRAAVEPLEPGALGAGARVLVTGASNVFPGAALRLRPHGAAAEPAAEEAAPGAAASAAAG